MIRGERVLVEEETKQPKKLPPVALRLSAKENVNTNQKSLEQRLVDAEVRREIEIEAIKYKAALASKPKKASNDENQVEELSMKMTTKMSAAASRREELLAAKAAKGALLAQRRFPDNDSSPSKKKFLDAKLNSASIRKAERLCERVEAAAALGTERVLGAAMNRQKKEMSARTDLKISLDVSLTETSRRKKAVLREIAERASRSGGSARLARVSQRFAIEKRARSLALSSKLNKATRLKQLRDQKAVEKAKKASKSKKNPRAQDIFRRQCLEVHLHKRSDRASQRREIETLDKVVKATTLGTAAVAHANTKRDVRAANERHEKEIKLETKLAECTIRRGALVQETVKKAARRSALIAHAAKSRKSNDNIRSVVVSEKVFAAERRRSESLDTKVAEASVHCRHVKTVLERKKLLEEDARIALKNSIDLKQEAAANRYKDNLEQARRGLNGKRHPHTYVPSRPTFKKQQQQQKDQQEQCTSTSYFSGLGNSIFNALISCSGMGNSSD